MAQGRAEKGPTADTMDARLAFGGAEAVFVSSRVAPERRRFMRLVYPSGEVNVDFLARTFENTTKFPLNADFASTPRGSDPLGANVGIFIDAVLGKVERPAVTGAEGAAVLQVALDIDKAAGLPSST